MQARAGTPIHPTTSRLHRFLQTSSSPTLRWAMQLSEAASSELLMAGCIGLLCERQGGEQPSEGGSTRPISPGHDPSLFGEIPNGPATSSSTSSVDRIASTSVSASQPRGTPSTPTPHTVGGRSAQQSRSDGGGSSPPPWRPAAQSGGSTVGGRRRTQSPTTPSKHGVISRPQGEHWTSLSLPMTACSAI